MCLLIIYNKKIKLKKKYVYQDLPLKPDTLNNNTTRRFQVHIPLL